MLLLFKSGSNAIGPIFNGISLAVRGLTLFGFCISVLQETTGIVLLEGLTPLAEIYPVIGSIGAFLAGILPHRLPNWPHGCSWSLPPSPVWS